MDAEFAFEEIKSKADELSESFKLKDVEISNSFILIMLLMLLTINGWNVDKEEKHDAESVSGV